MFDISINVDLERLHELRKRFPRAALELDLVSGRVSPETGLENPDHKNDAMQNLMELNVLEVLDVIDKQDHSGFTHGYLLGLLIPLLEDKPITPLTGNDWEWIEKSWDGSFQNKRCFRVFKDGKTSTAYNIDGRAFSDDGGLTWYTNHESFKDISFPCSNKDLETEHIYVVNGEE